MKLERWNPDAHWPLVAGWFNARGTPVADMGVQMLPATGYIADSCVAGWLYKTDSALAWLDGFVADPNAGADTRRFGVKCIARQLMADAKDAGIVSVCALTSYATVANVGRELGFTVVDRPFFYMARRL